MSVISKFPQVAVRQEVGKISGASLLEPQAMDQGQDLGLGM